MLAKRLTVFLYLGLTFATSRPRASFHVLEKREVVPYGFSSVGPAPPEKTISLRLALANNEDALIDKLYSVSDPSSPKYGQHLTKEEVNEVFHCWFPQNDAKF